MRGLTITSLLLACTSAERIVSDDAIGSLASTPQSAALQSAGTAAELAAAGAAAHMIVPRWHGSVSALSEVQAAAASARTWSSEVNSQVESAQTIIGQNNLQDLFGGSPSYDQLRALETGSAALNAAEGLKEAADQGALLSEMLGGLTDTMVSATGLSEGVEELNDVWARVDLSLVRALERRAGNLHDTFVRASTGVATGRTLLRPFIEDWDTLGSWTRARTVYSNSATMTDGFNRIGQSWAELEPAFGDLRHLVSDTSDAAVSLVDASRTIGYFADRGVGSDETIRQIFCSDRQKRTFSLDAEVDLRSMQCVRYSMLRMQRCECVSTDDCYVTSHYRPSPTSLKRCFRPQ